MDPEVTQQFSEMLREAFAHARWDAIVLIWNSFLTAAQTHVWIWGILPLWVLMAGRKKLLRLVRYVVGSFLRSEVRG